METISVKRIAAVQRMNSPPIGIGSGLYHALAAIFIIYRVISLVSDSSLSFFVRALWFRIHLHGFWKELNGFRFVSIVFRSSSLVSNPSPWFLEGAQWFQIRLHSFSFEFFGFESVSMVFGRSS